MHGNRRVVTSGDWEQLKDTENLEKVSKRLGHVKATVDKVIELRAQSPMVKPDAEGIIHMLQEIANELYGDFVECPDEKTTTLDKTEPNEPVIST
jgi:hypothetical protein